METQSLNKWGSTSMGKYISSAYILVILTVLVIVIKIPIDIGLYVISKESKSILDFVANSLLITTHLIFLGYFIYFGLIKQTISIPSSGGRYIVGTFLEYKGKSAIHVSIFYICLIIGLFLIYINYL